MQLIVVFIYSPIDVQWYHAAHTGNIDNMGWTERQLSNGQIPLGPVPRNFLVTSS